MSQGYVREGRSFLDGNVLWLLRHEEVRRYKDVFLVRAAPVQTLRVAGQACHDFVSRVEITLDVRSHGFDNAGALNTQYVWSVRDEKASVTLFEVQTVQCCRVLSAE